MKKLATALFALTFISSAHASLIFPVKGLPSASQIRLTKVEKVIKANNTMGFQTMNIKVFGTATFSNSCMVPESIIKEMTSNEHNHIIIRVLGVSQQDRICPMVYRPVVKKFLIDTVSTTDIMPVIEVNGEVI